MTPEVKAYLGTLAKALEAGDPRPFEVIRSEAAKAHLLPRAKRLPRSKAH